MSLFTAKLPRQPESSFVMRMSVSSLLRSSLFRQRANLHRFLHQASSYRSHSDSAKTDNSDDTFFITTPIYYVNAAPHVGHLYTTLLADAVARWNRVKGKKTLFTTGTDEHGLKIQQAAEANSTDPLIYCDKVSAKFKLMFEAANIIPDRFIRTTEPSHVSAVNSFWAKLVESGFIYKGNYSGWYCVSDEAFLTDDEVQDQTLPDGSVVKVSKESLNLVTWTEESNYTFRLSHFKQDLLQWLDTEPIHPKQFEPAVRKMIENLPDLSVTRSRDRLTWGIAVPGDPQQTIYVWVDALTNYLTVAGYPDKRPSPWPPHIQVIGKDIVRFHAIYWPAFLMAADMSPPPKLVVHSHWLVENVKMSKSRGNVVDPIDKMAAYGVDGFRYFLLHEGGLASDGTYSDKRVVERINSDLANTIGNLLGRCTSPAVNKAQQFPPLVEDDLTTFLSKEEQETHHNLYRLPDDVDAFYNDFHFPKAIDLIMSQFYWANAVFQAHKPWVLAKAHDDKSAAHLLVILHVAMETLRVNAILLQPIVPCVADRILERLGVGPDRRSFNDAKIAQTVADSQNNRLGEKIVLYEKILEKNSPS